MRKDYLSYVRNVSKTVYSSGIVYSIKLFPHFLHYSLLTEISRIYVVFTSVADPGCLSRIPDPGCLSRIPDPTFFHPRSRIPDPNCLHPGSRILIKEFKYFNPKESKKMVSKLKKIWSGLFIPDPGSGCWLSPIPDPGSRGQKGTQSRIPDPQHWSSLAHLFTFNVEVGGTVAVRADQDSWVCLIKEQFDGFAQRECLASTVGSCIHHHTPHVI